MKYTLELGTSMFLLLNSIVFCSDVSYNNFTSSPTASCQQSSVLVLFAKMFVYYFVLFLFSVANNASLSFNQEPRVQFFNIK